nr:conotoxin precursor Cerm03 [Conus ebraeus]UMA83902.1 conotoxin precursor Cerm03 [Conus judaeus]
MKLTVMFIVFLMLTMPMASAEISRRTIDGGEASVLAGDRATNKNALLQQRLCPTSCSSCSNC